MAACAHPELFNDEDEGGMKYIEFNRNFKMDCSILLEKVTQYVGTKVGGCSTLFGHFWKSFISTFLISK